ncbi:DMT family transporter [Haloarcula sp. S1AR25-5A]|uniref:DMT family transporter n=1 Tax=Haloarcula terrestris TaxID=2950533 RepID=A0AAE4EY29_9EURY|nr:EamA family transporter [Haloarcula terrestris]MDS0222370.1 DMT family transporter [Haloarcula terrestris]
MNAAVLFGLGTMISWGFWIALGNIASSTMDPETAAFVSYATAAVATGVYVVASDASLAVTNRGLVFAGAAGIAAAIGVVSTFIGVTVGSTSVVSTIGGMYFITAAVIGIIAFGESVTLTKVAGIGLALTAIVIINQ